MLCIGFFNKLFVRVRTKNDRRQIMRNTLDVIKERRSIRKFKPEQIKEEELQAIVESGLYAPSAINKQSWNFTVIQNQEILAELNEATKNVARNLDNEALKRIGENEKYNCFYYAPTVILVSGKDEERSKVMDCSAATQNMLIAAESLNIGSCWINRCKEMFELEKGQQYLQKWHLEDYVGVGCCILGYVEKALPEKKILENRIIQG